MLEGSRDSLRTWLRKEPVWLATLLVVSAVYMWQHAFVGWIPHDEGFIGQTAERILAGQTPHVDFNDMYTGLLSYWHALVFRLFGVRLIWIRLLLLVWALGWLCTFYGIARRLVPGTSAVVATLGALVWSLPNHFASLPSWYNLFFATFGCAALMRHADSSRRRWLVICGVMAGLSFLFKQTGLYFLVGASMYLVLAESAGQGAFTRRPGWKPMFVLKCVGAVLMLMGSWLLLRAGLSTGDLSQRLMVGLHFGLPIAFLLTSILWLESRRHGDQAIRSRLAGLARSHLLLGIGFMLPVILLVTPYVASGGMEAWIHGVFVQPRLRLQNVTFPFPPTHSLLYLIPVLLVFVPMRHIRADWNRWIGAALALAGVVVVSASHHQGVYQAVWATLRPIIVVIWLGTILVWYRQGAVAGKRDRVVLIASVTTFLNLTQYPYPLGAYLTYVAPFMILMVLGYVASGQANRRLVAIWAVVMIVFGLLWMNRGDPYEVGLQFRPLTQVEPLALERAAGLSVERADAKVYQELVGYIRRIVRPGHTILALGDCPEVYFLSAMPNPTPVLFDLFSGPWSTSRLHAVLEQNIIDAIVINTRPDFSASIGPLQVEELKSSHPLTRKIGKFMVLSVLPSERDSQ